MPTDTTITPTTKTVTLGNLDLKPVITKINPIVNKYDSEIKFAYDSTITTYRGPGYSIIYQLDNEPGKPKLSKAFPGFGGNIALIGIDVLNLLISFSDWDSLAADTTLEVTLGSQTQNIPNGTKEITFNDISFSKTGETEVTFAITIKNQYGSDQVKALLPLKITWTAA